MRFGRLLRAVWFGVFERQRQSVTRSVKPLKLTENKNERKRLNRTWVYQTYFPRVPTIYSVMYSVQTHNGR